jgi:hypothetical protein
VIAFIDDVFSLYFIPSRLPISAIVGPSTISAIQRVASEWDARRQENLCDLSTLNQRMDGWMYTKRRSSLDERCSTKEKGATATSPIYERVRLYSERGKTKERHLFERY